MCSTPLIHCILIGNNLKMLDESVIYTLHWLQLLVSFFVTGKSLGPILALQWYKILA